MKNIQLVSIILPTYNEAENIIDLIKAVDQHVTGKKEFIVVDDNSPDGTSEIVAKFIRENKHIPVRLKTRKTNPGLTNSIKEGITLMTGDVAVWLDCDFSMPPDVIPKLLKKIEEGYDIAKGSRYTDGGGVNHKRGSRDPKLGIYLSKMLNTCAQRIIGSSIKDYTTGFICVRKRVLEKITLQGDYGEYAPDFFLRSQWQGFTFAEVPFIAQPRLKGESKTGRNIWQYIRRGRKYLITFGKLVIDKRNKKHHLINSA
jgi:dolichol-phosphate mannosyltransferase